MNWYRVSLNGQNFLLNFEGGVKKFGFYTTRDVEAESLEDAEMKAVELLKNEKSLIDVTVNEKTDSPMIYVDEIRILEAGEKLLKNTGHTFYSETDE